MTNNRLGMLFKILKYVGRCSKVDPTKASRDIIYKFVYIVCFIIMNNE